LWSYGVFKEERIMVYGHFITDSIGNKEFFVEGCSYCRMSAGGQHEASCPLNPLVNKRNAKRIKKPGFIAWEYLSGA
jgi:hypothetical protein